MTGAQQAGAPQAPSPVPEENSPPRGEHFPRPVNGGLTRWQIFAPLGAALAAVMAIYVMSLKTQRTVTGLRAGGQPVGDVAFTGLDHAIDQMVDGFLDTRIVLAFGKDERVVKRRDLGFVVDKAGTKEMLASAGKSGN